MNTQNLISEFKQSIEADANAIKSRLDDLDRSIVEIAQKQVGYTSGDFGSRKSQSLGDEAADLFKQNADVFNKSGRLRLELKAASDPVTTASGRTIAMGGVGTPGGLILGLQNAMPTRQLIGTSALEYSRYTGLEGAAGVQANEGDAKAVVRPTHELITQAALTIAATTVMSRQALSDSQEMRRAVEITLNRACAATLDASLYNGTATPSWTGIGDLATEVFSDFDNVADAVSDTVGVMQLAGFVPDAIVVSPSTWVEIMTARADSGSGVYLSGNYLGMTEPALRGLRVVLSASVPFNTALVIDSTHVELVTVQTPIVEVGLVNDQFQRNLVTMLLEYRVIPVLRTVGAVSLAIPDGVSSSSI